jgi:hypothetical protein
MGSPIVKLDALTNLKTVIEAAIPDLAGKVTVHQAPSGAKMTFPNLSLVLGGRMQFEPAERLLQQDLGGNVVVWNVGAHEGTLQLRLVATTSLERMKYEQALLDLFTARELAPGVVVVPVVSTGGITWTAAFELDDSQWMDTGAQEREYDAIVNVNAVVPDLVVQTPVYTIDELILGLTHDMTTTFTPTTAVPPAVELVQINQDGTISHV